MTETLLEPLRPNRNALFPLFEHSVDDDMLWEIAQADYGVEATECFVKLRQIRQSDRDELSDFQLRDVLELTHWATRSGGQRGAWLKLFACTTLMLSNVDGKEPYYSENLTFAIFSQFRALELGRDVVTAGASVLAWRYIKFPGLNEDPAFLAFAILLMQVALQTNANRGPLLRELAESVLSAESHVRSRLGGGERPAWLLGLTSFDYESAELHRVERPGVEVRGPLKC